MTTRSEQIKKDIICVKKTIRNLRILLLTNYEYVDDLYSSYEDLAYLHSLLKRFDNGFQGTQEGGEEKRDRVCQTSPGHGGEKQGSIPF